MKQGQSFAFFQEEVSRQAREINAISASFSASGSADAITDQDKMDVLCEGVLKLYSHEFSTIITIMDEEKNNASTYVELVKRLSPTALRIDTASTSESVNAAVSSAPSKQICFNFRDRGHCRYGNTCRFAHQADTSGRPKTQMHNNNRRDSNRRDPCSFCKANKGKTFFHPVENCRYKKQMQEQTKFTLLAFQHQNAASSTQQPNMSQQSVNLANQQSINQQSNQVHQAVIQQQQVQNDQMSDFSWANLQTPTPPGGHPSTVLHFEEVPFPKEETPLTSVLSGSTQQITTHCQPKHTSKSASQFFQFFQKFFQLFIFKIWFLLKVVLLTIFLHVSGISAYAHKASHFLSKGRVLKSFPQFTILLSLCVLFLATHVASDGCYSQPPISDGAHVIFDAYALEHSSQRYDVVWILDSGATTSVCCDVSAFVPGSLQDYYACIKSVSGDTLNCHKRGAVILKSDKNQGSHELTVRDVLYIPEVTINIISVSQLDREGYTTTFGDGRATVQKGNITYLSAKSERKLYFANSHTVPGHPFLANLSSSYTQPQCVHPQPQCVQKRSHPFLANLSSSYTAGLSSIDLWHRRLGHASASYL
jgi:hypothetical protein